MHNLWNPQELSWISRVISNAVGYKEPLPEEQPSGRGVKRKYGEKVKLLDEFSKGGFISAVIEGQDLECKSINLLWKAVMEKVTFILVRTQCGKKFTLLSSDNTLSSEEINAAYKARTGIERSFRALKQGFGKVNCKKWSKKKQNEEVKLKSHEVFVMANIIAMGFTQLLSVGYSKTVWCSSKLWLRMINRNLPGNWNTCHTLLSRIVTHVLAYKEKSGRG